MNAPVDAGHAVQTASAPRRAGAAVPSDLLPRAIVVLVALVASSLPAYGQIDTTSSNAVQNAFQIDSIGVVGGSASSFFSDRFNYGVSKQGDLRITNIEDCPIYNNESPGSGDAACGVSSDGVRVLIKFSLPGQNTLYSRWSAKIGSCSKAAVEDSSQTSCRMVRGPSNTGSSGNEIQIELARLIGTIDPLESESEGARRGCCTDQMGKDTETKLYVYLAASDTETDVVELISIPFRFDYKAPATPADVDATSQGQTIQVSWTKVPGESEDDLQYRIFWSTAPFTEPATAGVSTRTVAGTASTATISVSEEGQWYFSVAAIDPADNLSGLSPNVVVQSIPTSDGFQYYKQLGGVEEGGFCFVATAAYGSYLDPHVEVLRHFRDRVLLQTVAGQGLVAAYYAHGDQWAQAIAARPWARALVRFALLPVIAVAWFVVELGFAGKLAMLLLGALVLLGARRALGRRYWVPGAQIAPVLTKGAP